MRKLIYLTLILASLWAGYWWIGARSAEQAFKGWFEERAIEGWVAEYEDLSVKGFPNRFDTIISGIDLADPDTGISWQADAFQILSLSYKPNHVIAVWPGPQTLSTPFQKITISADEFKGSLVVDPATNLPLNRSSFVLRNLALSSSANWAAKMGSVDFATRITKENTHDIHFSATELTPPKGVMDRFQDNGVLPAIVDGMTVNATVNFTAPWDRFALENARPQITHLALKRLNAKWGALELNVAGTVDVSTDGTPSGELQIQAKNWQKMLEIAETSGAISPQLVGTLKGALRFVSGLSGNTETLDVTLNLADGYISLGPIPLGRAPKIVIR